MPLHSARLIGSGLLISVALRFRDMTSPAPVGQQLG
jgi:hypothetical protein